jgi:hypothetical protein
MQEELTKDEMEQLNQYLQIIALFHRNGHSIDKLPNVNSAFRQLKHDVDKIFKKLTVEQRRNILSKLSDEK